MPTGVLSHRGSHGAGNDVPRNHWFRLPMENRRMIGILEIHRLERRREYIR